nr:hypothetical protein [Niabella hibiscisoli]
MELKGRDFSWLEFNERLLFEAADNTVPLAERLKFLSIYSSNLDEFSRVRIPTIIALGKYRNRAKPIMRPRLPVLSTNNRIGLDEL